MTKTDGRHLKPETLDHLRKQAVVLKKQGKTQIEIANALGVSRVSVGTWLKKYRLQGKKALKSQKRGRKFGQKRTLGKEQEIKIQKIIQEKTPDQLKMPFALWTRDAIKELILNHCGIHMPIRTIGEYPRRWGFTPQRPLKRAYEQRPEAIEKWLNEQYPSIVEQAKQENAQIQWGMKINSNNKCFHI